MRILWLKSDLLLPLDKGGKLRTWHLMRHLARRHAVTYLAFRDSSVSAANVAGMSEVAARVECVPRSDAPKRSLAFYADVATHVLSPLPYAVGKYKSREYASKLRSLLADGRFDLLVCDFLFPSVNLPRQLPCPAVLFTHNVESEIWRRHADTKARAVPRALYRLQYNRMLRYERRMLERFDGVLAVSDADRSTFGSLYPGAVRKPIKVVSTGVDTQYYTPASREAGAPRLVFTGSMDWLPNEDAMLFFCRDVLPLIRKQEPLAELFIVGRAPTPAVRDLATASNGVFVTGSVVDIRPFVGDASVYVVPLRVGGGTRLKIFEAMAMGKAVVSTTIGAEGLPVVNGTHAVIADGAENFAASVVDLLRDEPRRGALATAARALVVDRYDWSAVAGELEDALVAFAGSTNAHQQLAAPGGVRPIGCES